MLVVTPTNPERPAKKLTHAAIIGAAQAAFGGSNADGTFTAADAFDVLQFTIHRVVRENPARYDPTCGVVQARRVAADIKTLLERFPAQARRDAETDALQQFSTPPHYSYLGAWVANLSAADAVLEPSAGTASFVVHALNAGCAEVWANEISERRGKLLAELLPAGDVFAENAEQLDNVLPEHVAPTVILMNPPFSVSVNLPGQKVPAAACLHVDQALRRLADGGRLVAVLPASMGPDRGRFAEWWGRVRAAYNVRCNVGIPGDEYKKYGTTVDTRLVVIDKDGPTVNCHDGDALSVDGAFGLLETIRDSRPKVTTRPKAADAVAKAAPQLGLFGPLDFTSKRAVPRSTAAGYEPAARVIAADELRLAEPVATSDPLSAVLQAAARATRTLTDSTFEPYYPQRLRVEGAQPHPTPLVESAAMASVEPPAPTYAPSLPFSLLADGTLSDAQLEAVVYAGQAHRQFLEPEEVRSPFTGGDRPVRMRKGFFVGDGTGVGKGRELSAIILDSFARGARKAMWITKSPDLIRDAVRDWTDLGGRKDEIIDVGKIKAGQKITANRGILFATYGLLKQDIEDKKGRCRFKQIVEWLGGDAFDGVIGFDEAHAMQNAMEQKGNRGTKKPSQTATAGCNLQDACANAKVVYLSATGATEVSNLAYCHRLGLWGKGTAFPNKSAFVAQVDAGGVAAMELVARDLKQRGLYLSRGLSFDGVGYDRLTHVLTPDQRAIYNKLCQGWRVVLSNFEKALELTASQPNDSGRMVVDGKAKGRAYGRFSGAHQRFFNQILTAMQMPSVLEDVERHLAAGDAAVLQIVNTNEASMDRSLAKLGEGDDLDNIDLTPRDQIMQLIEHCFPVTQMDPEPDGKGMRVCKDSEGNPVLNRTAVALREKLLAEMSTISCPDGPLEMMVNFFGPKRVAEVTGRSRRVVRWRVDGVEKTYAEARSPIKAMAEAAEFQDGERDVLVFSDAGGTGKSYHDSNKNRVQRRRVHDEALVTVTRRVRHPGNHRYAFPLTQGSVRHLRRRFDGGQTYPKWDPARPCTPPRAGAA